jgi:hypothetical protein
VKKLLGLTIAALTISYLLIWWDSGPSHAGQPRYKLAQIGSTLGPEIRRAMPPGPPLRTFECVGGPKNCGPEKTDDKRPSRQPTPPDWPPYQPLLPPEPPYQPLLPPEPPHQPTPPDRPPYWPLLPPEPPPHSVPEPSTLALLAMGLGLLAWRAHS